MLTWIGLDFVYIYSANEFQHFLSLIKFKALERHEKKRNEMNPDV
jgi:hypothetical protein